MSDTWGWIKELLTRNQSEDGKKTDILSRNADGLIILSVIIILGLATVIGLSNYVHYEQYQRASSVGIAAFTIPIILALSRRFNLASRFGSGEVRKAIVISLTVIYIIMLSSYFYNVTLPLGENLSKPISNSSELVSLPVTTQLGNNSLENPSIPSAALKDITTNFFWVYAVIIVFYFGSRAWESVTEAKMVKDLGDEDPLKLAQKRLALGMLSPENYDDISRKLREDTSEKFEGEVVLEKAVPEKDASKFNLTIKNLSSEDRTVIQYSVDGVLKPAPSITVPAKGGSISISVDIEDKKKAKHKFTITPDKGAESTLEA